MFTMGNVDFDVPRGLPFYLLLGVICGVAAIGLTKLLYWMEDQFERLPMDNLWHPAIGGLAVGVIGFFIPRILGVGYDTISDILNGNLALKLLILIAVFKTLGLVISLGSGTSGGLLAPTFMSSAALGGAFAMVVNMIFPGAHLSPGAYALVAMAAVFGAASRATFAFIVFAFEITRDYNAILPLMLACVIADMLAIHFLPSSIMTEKLARRGLLVPQEYEGGILKIVRVGEVMRTDVLPIPAEMTVGDLAERISHAKLTADGLVEARTTKGNAMRERPALNLTDGLPIVGSDGRLAGMVTQGDLLRALKADPQGEITVLEAGSNRLIVAYENELVFDAMHRMLENNIGRLPVVSREEPGKMVGYFNRASLLSAWARQVEEEGMREHGWLDHWLTRNTVGGNPK
jgi:CIC family chloride channel protein